MTDTLDRLLRPRAIAVLGASADFNKLGGRPVKFLLDKGYGGRILPVNPRYATIGPLDCYPSVAAAPGPVDLAIVSLPAERVIDSIRELGAAGVAAAVVFSSGFAEMGEEGAAMEQALANAARKAGVRILGPNCLGFVNAFEKVIATFSQYANGETPAGPVGFVTQSGAFGTAISALARGRGLGFGYFVNTGNEGDLGFSEVMEAVIADPRIRVGAGYIEGLGDGAGLIRCARRAARLGKPVVLTKVGRSAAGARAAASHTGSLAGEDAVFAGIARQFGLIRARNEEHMLDIVECLAFVRPPAGPGVGIVTQSGGAGVLMADRAEELGLRVPVLRDATVARLRRILPAFGAAGNPVDVTAQFIAEPEILRESVKALLDDPQIDVAVVWFQLMNQFVAEIVDIFRDLKATTTKPIVPCWVAGPAEGIHALHALGFPVLRGAEPAIDAVAAMVAYGRTPHVEVVPHLPSVALPPRGGIAPTMAAAAALAAAGVPLVEAAPCRDVEAALEAAESFGYPLAMKIESPDLPHKTEAGGVRLGIADAAGVREAYAAVTANACKYAPDARIDGVVVQRMAPGSVELVVGLKRDAVFGTVVMAGLGGIHVELFRDVVFRKAPVGEDEALAMLASLKGAALLDGLRGAPPVDRTAVARLIAAVSRFGAAAGDRLLELDLNPVLAGPDGAVAVDWLLALEES